MPIETQRATSNPYRIVAFLALSMGVSWIAKVAAMAADGGSDDSLLVAVLYFAGLLLLVAVGAALGWVLARRLHVAARTAIAVLGAVIAFAVHQAMDVVGDAIVPGTGWFQEESSIWLTAVLALALAGVLFVVVARRK